MRVALVTEGTYPFVHGGVSVWCDRLIRSLPDIEFKVYGVAPVTGRASAWSFPPNVVSFQSVGLERTEGPAFERYRAAGRRWFLEAFEEFVRAMLRPPAGPVTSAAFLGGLRQLFGVGRVVPIDVGIRSPEAFELLRSIWTEREVGDSLDRLGAPSLLDVLEVSSSLAHFLKPLRTVPTADLTHATANGLASLVALAGLWRQGAPILLTEHGVYLRERYLEARKPRRPARAVALELMFFRHLNDATLNEADLIVPVSDFNRRWELRTGADPNRVHTIYNGVDPAAFPPLISEPDLPTVTWVGRIDPLKDLKTLIEAFARVRRSIPPARLRLFGPVPPGNEAYHRECRDWVAYLGLEGAVAFEGHISNPSGAHDAGHVVALSSISEGFPFTVIEAMMSGRAVVSTDVGGVAEAIGDAGLLVRPRDPVGLAGALVQVLTDHELRRHLGRAARERALALFTLDRMSDLYRLAYQSVLRGEPMAAPLMAAPEASSNIETFPITRRAVGS